MQTNVKEALNKEMEESPGGLVVKDLALSLLWLRSLLWWGFDPWPGNFCMPWAWQKKKKKKKKKRAEETAPGNKSKVESYPKGIPHFWQTFKNIQMLQNIPQKLWAFLEHLKDIRLKFSEWWDWVSQNFFEPNEYCVCVCVCVFLGPHPQHMEVPRPGVESEP